jgi:lipid A 3-O-deacylase
VNCPRICWHLLTAHFAGTTRDKKTATSRSGGLQTAIYSSSAAGKPPLLEAREEGSPTGEREPIANETRFLMVAGLKAFLRLLCAAAALVSGASATAGTESDRFTSDSQVFDPPRFEVAAESAYLLGVFGNPHSYEIGAEFLTGRIRWGVVNQDGWLRGYNQFYLSAVIEPIFRGVENHYFGLNFGLRYNFVQPNSRFVPYFSGGLGLGWIDSNPDNFGSQGQDFTFNILMAAGVSYKLGEQWKVEVGILYQHLSNGGQSDPNPSLNLLGPQIAIRYSF